jgi:hypothetical protein
MTKAETILKQLGGGRFVMMTGAKDLVAGESKLQFCIPGGKKVIIELTADDLYTVTLGKFNRKTFEFKVISEQPFVYNDQLTKVFEKMTGLYTSI